MMNNITDITTGAPKPPFFVIAPRGAPMKKKMKQANANVNLRYSSISCRRIARSVSPAPYTAPVSSFPD